MSLSFDVSVRELFSPLLVGARLVIVNASPTPYDDVADEVVREPIGTALPRLLQDLAA